MITPEEAKSKAEENFHNGCNCAQAVLCTFAKELGLDNSTAMKIAQPLGGGMCRMREVCGTVSGMLMALGLAEGTSDTSDKDAKDSVYKHGQALAGEFKKSNGSIICRELLGLVPLGASDAMLEKSTSSSSGTDISKMTSPVSEARTDAYYKKRPCQNLCGDAAEILAKYLAQKK